MARSSRTGAAARSRRPLAAARVAASVVLAFAAVASPAAAGESIGVVAVFPVENLSAGSAPVVETRSLLIEALVSRGIRVLRSDVLDEFFARHRVRYTAGLDVATAEALRRETGVEAVLVASVELSLAAVPPKVALMARLVSIDGVPVVAWADDVGLAGDDAPGLFDLGLVDDYRELHAAAMRRLTASLLAYLQARMPPSHRRAAAKFQPRSHYRAISLEPERRYTVAVVPFFNLSPRRNAGEILALLFARHLAALPPFRVLDTGVIRRQLIDARIVMDAGLSLVDAETVAALVDADFVLAGRVIRYDDYEGVGVIPRVEFSAVLIDRSTRRVVWSSDSDNQGSDGVRFFERGASRTAHVMATQMVQLTSEMIAGAGR
jgi:TolB-like protein